MKRLHVHVSVADIAQSVRFYSTLFAAEPAVLKPDYAKWMLDDPRVNFAISSRGATTGLDHLVYDRLQKAGRPVLEEGATTCCYAQSEKAWITDPQELPWETFLTSGESTVYGDSPGIDTIRTASGGLVPGPAATGACCAPKQQVSA
jgi:catechol 2,3-dioxygenase-like lactoylglutathione lyase family enzyme